MKLSAFLDSISPRYVPKIHRVLTLSGRFKVVPVSTPLAPFLEKGWEEVSQQSLAAASRGRGKAKGEADA